MFGSEGAVPTVVKERRLFDRLVARLPVKLSEAQENFSADVYLRDICAGGAKLITRQRLIPQENVDFWVHIPDGKEPLRLGGKVVWAKEVGRDVWDTGVRFERIRFMDLHRVFNL